MAAKEIPIDALLIRPALVGDAPRLIEFQLRMALETEDLELDLPIVQAGVQAVFDDPSKGTYWVAEKGGHVVGGLLTWPEWSDWRNGTVWWIASLYVVPEARGEGVYRRLWNHLEAQVEASPELIGIRLYVDKRNGRARQVYEALGMSAEHYELFEWLK
jgi:GNAT superfamily N-acetyltransferase